ncbi:hypothetical protein KZO01_17260 [Kurthia zopfii]|uniref:Tetratricopeptide repeat protein n=1 Tax=Kurthia zopfii TaxID=1650 RepID=A0A8B4Q6F8_9BACL|nr:tetratricopeptide repeat protein [Kurthia zopfii]PWI22013.1 hypothetical protein DF281_09360 [Kurthia zopfii]TDR34933.1 hypothetical protein DFR61_13413 [Kurthia zopfii]GEK31417.1 hypothetical protein KZO01_17260 [Kurthia zopfii]STX08909.1 Uncharacterised protein [Kurthia zopfii]
MKTQDLDDIELKSNSLHILFEEYKIAKSNNNIELELSSLMQLLEQSFLIFEEYLIFDFFEYCENLCYELNNGKHLTRLYELIALVYYKQKDFDQAIKFYKIGLKIAIHCELHDLACKIYCHIARCLIQKKQLEDALRFAQAAQCMIKTFSISNQSVIIRFHIEYSEILYLLDHRELSVENFKYLENILTLDNLFGEKANIYWMIAKGYSKERDYEIEYNALIECYNCLMMTGHFQKQIDVLEALLNCPAKSKTSAEQNSFMNKQQKLLTYLQKLSNSFSFKKLFQKFDDFYMSYDKIPKALDEEAFNIICNEWINDQPHLFLFTLDDLDELEMDEIIKKYSFVVDIFHTISDPNIISVCGFFNNQLFFLFKNTTYERINYQLPRFLQTVEQQVGTITFAHVIADDSLANNERALYSAAYAQHYYKTKAKLKMS